MNEYIINPAWFYWVHIAGAMKAVLLLSAGALLLFSGVVCLLFMDSLWDEERERYGKALPKVAIAGIACLVIGIFIPSKETLIEMQIARYATWENAEWTVDAIKDAVDYIVDAIKSIR
ncbi:MAG: hypothetical protein IJI40_01755 [Firmicutes bacterium]|nr:hypothetical protein [Bacillota bacterium]